MLYHRLRRRANIKPASSWRIVFARNMLKSAISKFHFPQPFTLNFKFFIRYQWMTITRFNPYGAGPNLDVRLWRLKSIPAL